MSSDKKKTPPASNDDISLKKLVGKMPDEWRKKLQASLKGVRAKDPGLGMILKAEMDKLVKEIEAKKKQTAPNQAPSQKAKVIDIRKKKS